jgi:hemerythrin-like domain-containing protein
MSRVVVQCFEPVGGHTIGGTVASNEHTIDTHDMLLIHRVIRREIGQLPGLIRAAAGDASRARIVGAHATEMLDFLHVHHSGEDELLYPLLRQRVSLDSELIDRMEAQHAEVDAAVRAVTDDLAAWSAHADPVLGERITARIDTMVPVLIEHLAEEEEHILPVVSTTISQQEWNALGKHGFSSIPGKRRLIILGHIIEETDDTERRTFLLNVPPPARIAYRLIGHRQFARETNRIRG